MYEFTAAQQKKALFWLVLFHILIIAASNYLVQFPFQIFGIHTTWGAFSFPFIFLATDLTVRIFGSHLARRIIFWVMFPALLLSYIFSVLFHDGSWMGLNALSEFNTFVGRIALASFAAYALGQILDIFVGQFQHLKALLDLPFHFQEFQAILSLYKLYILHLYKLHILRPFLQKVL